MSGVCASSGLYSAPRGLFGGAGHTPDYAAVRLSGSVKYAIFEGFIMFKFISTKPRRPDGLRAISYEMTYIGLTLIRIVGVFMV